MLTPRPIVDCSFIQVMLDMNEDSVLELVEDGLVFPAWQIQCCIGSKRRELRILSAGLNYYIATQRPLPADPAAVCADLFPPDAPLTTATLRRTLSCSSELVCDLVKAKAIALAPGAVVRPGRDGAAKLDRRSAIEFLKKRLV